MTNLHFLERFILNESQLCHSSRPIRNFFLGGGQGGGGFEIVRPFWSLVSTLIWKLYVRNITQSGQQALVFLPIKV